MNMTGTWLKEGIECHHLPGSPILIEVYDITCPWCGAECPKNPLLYDIRGERFGWDCDCGAKLQYVFDKEKKE